MAKMKKILCVVWVLVLVFGLCACAASNPTGTSVGQMPTEQTTQSVSTGTSIQMGNAELQVPYFDLALMPQERKIEVVNTWEQNRSEPLDWETNHFFRCRFYGDFGNCVVILHPTVLHVERSLTIAGYTFYDKSPFSLYVYKDGDIYGIQKAYEDGVLTQEQIGLIHDYHESWEQEKVPYFDLSSMSAIRKKEVAIIWNQYFVTELDWNGDSTFCRKFYGDFGNCMVILSPVAWPEQSSITIADYTFSYPCAFSLYCFANGRFRDLQSAYERGLITQEQIGLVHAYHESIKGSWEEEVPTVPTIPPFTQPERPPYPFEGSFDPDALLVDIPSDVQLQIKQALADQFDPTHEHIRVERVGLEVFGIFEDVYAVRSVGVFIGMDALESETINGLRFTYSDSAAVLFIYYDGHWYRLREAFDARIIGEEELLVIYENHYKAFPYLWGY